MTRRASIRRALCSLAVASALPLLMLGCPKKEQPAAPDVYVPPPPASSTASDLQPLDTDAGEDSGPDTGHHAGGHAGNINQARIKQCCTAMRKQFGTAPEMQGIISTCDAFAAQAAPNANAPEFQAFRQAIKGHILPAGCSGL